uniref:Uncharacterized protein n=1 Tax=Amphimedon queenslandica TaxID=400682 RepID=A0A1X7V4D3_AMPQE
MHVCANSTRHSTASNKRYYKVSSAKGTGIQIEGTAMQEI